MPSYSDAFLKAANELEVYLHTDRVVKKGDMYLVDTGDQIELFECRRTKYGKAYATTPNRVYPIEQCMVVTERRRTRK